jgi:hypothetical protein
MTKSAAAVSASCNSVPRSTSVARWASAANSRARGHRAFPAAVLAQQRGDPFDRRVVGLAALDEQTDPPLFVREPLQAQQMDQGQRHGALAQVAAERLAEAGRGRRGSRACRR